MSKGSELFVLRERLLEYLYDEGALSHRVRVHIDTILEALNFESTDYLVMCDSLTEAGWVKTSEDDGSGEAQDLSHRYVWLTESGFQHAHHQKPTGTTSDVETDIFRGRLDTLLETKQIYTRNLNVLERQRAKHGVNAPVDVINQIEDAKKQIAEVDAEIDEIKQKISGLRA